MWAGFTPGERVYYEDQGCGTVVDPHNPPANTRITNTMRDYGSPGTNPETTYVPIIFDGGYRSAICARAVRSLCPRKRGRS